MDLCSLSLARQKKKTLDPFSNKYPFVNIFTKLDLRLLIWFLFPVIERENVKTSGNRLTKGGAAKFKLDVLIKIRGRVSSETSTL